MKIVVTGASSHLARVLIPRLLQDPGITELAAIDWRPCSYPDSRFRMHQMDIRSEAVAGVLAGANAVIHLAFVVLRGDLGEARKDRALMRSINVDGSCQLFEWARAAGVPTLIHSSSASVYHQDGSARPLVEEDTLGPVPGFLYAHDKADVERWLDSFENQDPQGPRVVRLRPHGIVGPHSQPAVRRLVRTHLYPRFANPQPLLQCVHEDDVADAFVLALHRPVRGAFNLAPDDALSIRAMVTRRRLHCGIPFDWLEWMARMSWQLLPDGVDPSWLPALRRSLVLSNVRARTVLGWQPQHATVMQCLGQG